MKVKTTLRKIMADEFRSTFKKVMENWAEAKDVMAFVKIAQVLEDKARAYSASLGGLTEKFGFEWEGRKIIKPDDIQDKLLQKYGKFNAQSQLSIGSASEENKTAFLEHKSKAEACFEKYKEAVDSLLDESMDLDIPRTLKVTPNHIRKGLTPRDCFVLEPIFDLTQVSDPEAKA